MCEYIKHSLHIIEYILCWIETHPVFIGVTVPMIVGIFTVRKYAKNKRLEACFGFYASLKLQLNHLKTLLDEKKMLNIETSELGNIYTLLYDTNILPSICPSFHFPENDYLCTISDCCEKIQNTIMNSNCNINPTSITRSNWDNDIQTIYNFCEFIRTYQKNVSLKISNEKDTKASTSKYKHVQACEDFIKAIENIIESINKACKDMS